MFYRKYYTPAMVLCLIQACWYGWSKKDGAGNFLWFLLGAALLILSPFYINIVTGSIAGITAVVLTAAVCAGIIFAASAESSGRTAVSGGEGKVEMETEIQLAAADRETLQASAPGEKAEGRAGNAGQTPVEGQNGGMGQTDGVNQAGSADQMSGAAQTGNTGLPEGISQAGAEQESATAQSAPGPENQAEPPAKSARPQELIVDSDRSDRRTADESRLPALRRTAAARGHRPGAGDGPGHHLHG